MSEQKALLKALCERIGHKWNLDNFHTIRNLEKKIQHIFYCETCGESKMVELKKSLVDAILNNKTLKKIQNAPKKKLHKIQR
jgi:hypothetical protein